MTYCLRCKSPLHGLKISVESHLPFCAEPLLTDLAVLRVVCVVDLQVEPQGAQLLEAFIALCAVEVFVVGMGLL